MQWYQGNGSRDAAAPATTAPCCLAHYLPHNPTAQAQQQEVAQQSASQQYTHTRCSGECRLIGAGLRPPSRNCLCCLQAEGGNGRSSTLRSQQVCRALDGTSSSSINHNWPAVSVGWQAVTHHARATRSATPWLLPLQHGDGPACMHAHRQPAHNKRASGLPGHAAWQGQLQTAAWQGQLQTATHGCAPVADQ